MSRTREFALKSVYIRLYISDRYLDTFQDCILGCSLLGVCIEIMLPRYGNERTTIRA